MNDAGAGSVRPADAVDGNLVDRFAPAAWQPYLRMARIDRPIGWWLLLLPCWWSTALAAQAAGARFPDVALLALFFVGAVAMRGAGSTWNDIVDRKIDAKVERTRNRPLPSGAISVRQAVAFGIGLCLVGLAVLLSLNGFAIAIGFASMAPVIAYPFMKRITHHPQIVLGLAFSWGALMGFAATLGSLPLSAILLYAGTVLWVVGYDTIYAVQDIEDDSIVGIGSTARVYGARAPRFVAVCYAGAVLFMAAAVWPVGGVASWLGLLGFAAHLGWQAARVDVSNPELALRLFRSNRDAGLIFFAGLAIDPVLRGLLS